jgi:dinuclear metal center YbgI/SA1388 family protein
MTADTAAEGASAAAGPPHPTVGDVVAVMARRYPPQWAHDWDRVGLVVGDLADPVRRVLLAVDCVPQTVAQAQRVGAQMMIVHHPLLLRGVHSVATTTYKGAAVHALIRSGIALLVAHTNADVASPGVSDALAQRLGLVDVRPILPDVQGQPRQPGRVGVLAVPLSLSEFTEYVAARLPATTMGVRAAGDPNREIRTVAVCGGAGDFLLGDLAGTESGTGTGIDAYLTADLRHHPVSEHGASGGPALLDAAHWATERPWLDLLAPQLRADLAVDVVISDLVTDSWTLHAQSTTDSSPSTVDNKPVDNKPVDNKPVDNKEARP